MTCSHGAGSNRSVLMLARHFPPENNIASDRPFRFYKHLPRFGFDVHVVTASAQDPKHFQKNVVCALEEPAGSKRHASGNAVDYLVRPLINQDSLRWASAAYNSADRIIRQYKPGLIFSTSPPVVSNVVAGLLARRYRIPWVADFRDPVVGNPDRKYGGLAHYRDVTVEKWTFRSGLALIANTDSALAMWKRNYPQYQDKMHLIWNGFDADDIVEPLPIPDRGYKLLIHAGGINDKRHPGRLLASVLRLLKSSTLTAGDLRIRLIGPVSNGWSQSPDVLGKLVRLGCLEYDGQLIPRAEARMAMASADALVLLDLLPRDEALQVPGKIFDYIRIGRPVLASTTRDSPVERLLILSGIPHVSVYPDDCNEEIDSKLLRFLSLPNRSVFATDRFWKNFDAAQQTRQLASLFSTLVPQQKANLAVSLVSASGEGQ